MTDNRDELLVQRFFEENPVRVEDDGFTHRVMRHLPDRTRRLSRIWTAACVVVGVALLIKINAVAIIVNLLRNEVFSVISPHLTSLNVLIAIFALTSLLFVGGCGMIIKEK